MSGPSVWSIEAAVDEVMRLTRERKLLVERLNALAEKWMQRAQVVPPAAAVALADCQSELDELLEELERSAKR